MLDGSTTSTEKARSIGSIPLNSISHSLPKNSIRCNATSAFLHNIHQPSSEVASAFRRRSRQFGKTQDTSVCMHVLKGGWSNMARLVTDHQLWSWFRSCSISISSSEDETVLRRSRKQPRCGYVDPAVNTLLRLAWCFALEAVWRSGEVVVNPDLSRATIKSD